VDTLATTENSAEIRINPALEVSVKEFDISIYYT
jgi:hypothetical protein